jgi:large subunit ribosomal protein L18e
MKKLKSSNPELLSTIRFLNQKARHGNIAIWRDVAERLSSSRRSRVAVNLSRLNRYTKGKETVVVPGKVLGAGKIDHPIYVAAFSFSHMASLKISEAKGKCMFIMDLLKNNPDGSNVRIME